MESEGRLGTDRDPETGRVPLGDDPAKWQIPQLGKFGTHWSFDWVIVGEDEHGNEYVEGANVDIRFPLDADEPDGAYATAHLFSPEKSANSLLEFRDPWLTFHAGPDGPEHVIRSLGLGPQWDQIQEELHAEETKTWLPWVRWPEIPKKRPGRKGKRDMEWALIARRRAELEAEGHRSPNKVIAEEWNVSRVAVEKWMSKVRDLGYLQADNTLGRAAEVVLAKAAIGDTGTSGDGD